MLFDVQAALADILQALSPATPATSATPSRRVASVAGVATPPVRNQENPRSAEPDADCHRHGRSVAGAPVTWTGRVVSLDQWRRLSDWDKHGPDGRVYNGLT